MPGGAQVVTLGEALVALVASEPSPLAEVETFRRFVAGAEANVAVGLARLGHSVAFVGRVGADAFGTAIVRWLRGEGVDVSSLTVDSGAPTGVLIREQQGVGGVEVAYYRAASAGSRLGPEDVEAAADRGSFRGRWLHVTGITPALSASARAAVSRAIDHARDVRMTVSLDVNARRKLWTDDEAVPVLRSLAARCDVVLGDRVELAMLASRPPNDDPLALAEEVLALGPAIVIVKLGAGGAAALTSDGTRTSRPALAVPIVVDRVGAGDAFTAGWIGARLDGAAAGHALDAGNAFGAAAIGALGDMRALPSRAELRRLLDADAPDVIR